MWSRLANCQSQSIICSKSHRMQPSQQPGPCTEYRRRPRSALCFLSRLQLQKIARKLSKRVKISFGDQNWQSTAPVATPAQWQPSVTPDEFGDLIIVQGQPAVSAISRVTGRKSVRTGWIIAGSDNDNETRIHNAHLSISQPSRGQIGSYPKLQRLNGRIVHQFLEIISTNT